MIVTISTSLQRSKSVYLNILDKTVLLDVSHEFLKFCLLCSLPTDTNIAFAGCLGLFYWYEFRHQAQNSFSRMVCQLSHPTAQTLCYSAGVLVLKLSSHNRAGLRRKETSRFERLKNCRKSLPTRSFNLVYSLITRSKSSA